jgi:hypothetical protein
MFLYLANHGSLQLWCYCFDHLGNSNPDVESPNLSIFMNVQNSDIVLGRNHFVHYSWRHRYTFVMICWSFVLRTLQYDLSFLLNITLLSLYMHFKSLHVYCYRILNMHYNTMSCIILHLCMHISYLALYPRQQGWFISDKSLFAV